MTEKLGLIAGNGQFPVFVAREAKKAGFEVVAAAIEGEANQPSASYGDKVHCVALGQLGALIDVFKSNSITKAIMAGQVKHKQLFAGHNLDALAVKLLSEAKDKKTDTILGMVAGEFARAGITVLSSTMYLAHMLAPEGLICGSIDENIQKDIEFGTKIARAVAAIDIGQTICVKSASVVAVEAMEGTDECIARAGNICGEGVVAIKVAKPNQDLRFDVPVIGLKTIETLAKVKARSLVIEAGKTLVFDREEILKLASESNLTIVGIKV